MEKTVARKASKKTNRGAEKTSASPHAYRSHTCGALRGGDVGGTARLSGWVHRVRDHGGLLFIDLRDHYGMTQCVVEPDSPAFAAAERCRAEWVIRVDGTVDARTADTVNPNMPTGDVELRISEIEVLSEAEELPLPVFGEPDYPEDTRLKYRFLDLRRETIHRNIMKRAAIIASIRRRMVDAGFFEFQTPILTASSPEGARDFLVPSRIHPGKFYALPQAPQQFKQLIMMAGFDRYFQIAPCFRDEDPRADRLPGEFYQLDVEMSFVEQADVFAAMEPVMRELFVEFADGKKVTEKLPLIPYSAAMRAYGSDKPDLRNPLFVANVTDVFRDSDFKIFASMIAKDPNVEVWAIPAPGGGSRAFCDRMNSWAQAQGQPGLGYIFWREGEDNGAGPIAKSLGSELTGSLRQFVQDLASQGLEDQAHDQINPSRKVRLAQGLPSSLAQRYLDIRPNGLEAGDAIFFVAGVPAKVARFAGEARDRVGAELKLVDEDRFELAWIVDFPFYEWDENEKKIDFSHNPFSMPQGGLDAMEAAKSDEDLLALKAYQYDLVCNGYEIASGAIRNHLPELMYKAFGIVGYGPEVVDARFGGMIRALKFGAPPHGGMAAGIDRMVMLLCGAENLREITLFPMNQRAEDLLMGAPSEVSARQLQELHIRLSLPKT
ncbi:MAG: aspartate--tRNA ligase [Rhodomicrobiaceae bacterium]